MSDLICRRTMRRCETPSMCTPYGGCFEEVTPHIPALSPAKLTAEEIARQFVRNWVCDGTDDEMEPSVAAVLALMNDTIREQERARIALVQERDHLLAYAKHERSLGAEGPMIELQSERQNHKSTARERDIWKRDAEQFQEFNADLIEAGVKFRKRAEAAEAERDAAERRIAELMDERLQLNARLTDKAAEAERDALRVALIAAKDIIDPMDCPDSTLELIDKALLLAAPPAAQPDDARKTGRIMNPTEPNPDLKRYIP